MEHIMTGYGSKFGYSTWRVIKTQFRNDWRALLQEVPWEYHKCRSNKTTLSLIDCVKMRFSLLIPVLTWVTCLPEDFDPLKECLWVLRPSFWLFIWFILHEHIIWNWIKGSRFECRMYQSMWGNPIGLHHELWQWFDLRDPMYQRKWSMLQW